MFTMYVPPAEDEKNYDKTLWETTSHGYDKDKMEEAVHFALVHEFDGHREGEDVEAYLYRGGMTSKNEGIYANIVGPTKVRGGVSGMVLINGRIAAEWGDTYRPDMTFSCTKSYLSTVASFAWKDGLLRATPDGIHVDDERGLDDSVLASERRHCGDIRPEHEANEEITWRQLLQQTSEWRGVLWSKSDVVDHNRNVGGNTPNMAAGDRNAKKGEARPYRAPGTYWEYNDVRVNRLSLALMRVLGQPLPGVLREKIMGPIGCSSTTWDWHGYSTSWEKLSPSGVWAKGVSGGGHWGGGLHISTRDHARFGLLLARGGKWGDKQLIPDGWVARATQPCTLNEEYGFMWWLPKTSNTMLPRTSFMARGAGGNFIFIDPAADVVVVARWCSDRDGLLKRVMDALTL